VLHCVAIPLAAALLIMIHFWRVRKDGAISGPMWCDQAIRKRPRSSGPGVPWSGLARRQMGQCAIRFVNRRFSTGNPS